MRRREFLTAGAGSLLFRGLCGGAARVPAKGPLRAFPANPRYFTDGSGRAVYLSGAHTWANLQDSGVAPVPRFNWSGYLDMMEQHNHNFMRLWTWEQAAWAPWTPEKILYEPVAYLRTGPGTAGDGGPRFDLTRFNPAFFDRMRVRITECRDRGIYVAVMLFQGFSVKKRSHCGDPWPAHPYNRQNNVNGVDGERKGDSVLDLASPAVRQMHAAYLRKVVDTVNDLDNVLYEVINEGGDRDWDWFVVDTVHKLERDKGRMHPVGLTAGGERLEEMLASSADWISPGTRDNGYYKTDPPAWDGRKVSVLDTDHLWGHGGNAPWVWKSFLRGYNTLLMDSWEPIAGRACPEVNWGPRPGYPRRDLNRGDDPTWEPVRQALGNTRQYSLRMNLAACAPADYLASTHFCLANPGKQYLVYLPEGDAVTLDLSGARGMLECEWMHPTAGTITAGGAVEGGGRRVFPSPLIGPSALYVWQS